jgi:hypothetical protein
MVSFTNAQENRLWQDEYAKKHMQPLAEDARGLPTNSLDVRLQDACIQ